MPELPEVETIKAAMVPSMQGKTIMDIILNRPDLRFPIPQDLPQIAKNKEITNLIRRGKYILIHLSDANTIILHLGMSGRITIVPPHTKHKDTKHDHVIFKLNDDTTIVFNDPRRFGMLLLLRNNETLESHKLFKSMGPEPLGNEFNGPILATRLKGKTSSIKTAILDQRIVCGVGNIYACEALYEAQIHPEAKAGSLSEAQYEKLAQAIKNALTKAIAAGGSSLKDYKHTDGSLGYFQTQFKVYDRENTACTLCKDTITRFTQSGRSTFYCPTCQK